MNNSKLNLIQSMSEQQQKASQLQTSLQQLSQTLINFEQHIAQSEKPITESTMLLHQVHQTTIALESHLHSILSEIENLSPQSIKILTTSYMEQIRALQVQLSNIDISSIKTITTSIDSFSTSIQSLQSQVQSIKIDQDSLLKIIQSQVRQVIAKLSEPIQSDFETLITEKLSSQKAAYIFFGAWIFTVLMILITSYLGYQTSSKLKTIEAQQQIIQQNSKTITSQINFLNNLQRK